MPRRGVGCESRWSVRNSRRTGLVLLAVTVAVLFFAGPPLLGFYVDWLWFGEVGQRRVFWALTNARLLLGFMFGFALAVLALLNVGIARRFFRRSGPYYIPPRDAPEWVRTAGMVAREGLTALLVVGAIVLGVLGGIIAAAHWEDWVRFLHPQAFGIADPIFHQDVSFYIFRYPFLRFVNGWLFTTLLLIVVGTAAVYYLDGAVSFLQGEARISANVRTHLSILLGLVMLVKAWDYRLDQYGLLLESRSVLFGAGFTDVHARLPALTILMVVAVIAALGFFWNARARALLLPGLALALMVVTGVTVGAIYPALIQRFQVVPNQQAKERPYIEHHLDFTRRAYGLDQAESREYALGQALAPSDLTAEKDTLDNIRLWDYRVLSRAYQRLQGLREFYDVSDVDVDRYRIDGDYRQVMLAPRELVPGDRQTAQTWVNQTLQYTHGYGLVMSRVNTADPGGWPSWLVSNLPLETAPGIALSRPQLYYGMQKYPPVIAGSRMPEIDYPRGSENVTSVYQSSGGIPLKSAWLRTVFSIYTGDWNVLLSDQVQPGSRMMIRRQVRERTRELAPFLRYDSDPYLVVLDGRLVWVQDAYTFASTYPYSQPTVMSGGDGSDVPPEEFNYFRNSVKVTVDAYSGEVIFYAVDETDPLLQCYRRAFSGLFHPATEMPAGLREHIRYPEDILRVQAAKLTRFHVTNPDVFYQGTDVWDIPAERLEETGGSESVRMEPYYVVTRLPGEKEEEFALILPFKTRNGTTMTAWLAARCDGPSYGHLRVYRMPTASQIDEPAQVESGILADAKVSAQTSLLNQGSSRVRYGNLLVLPVGHSILYVKPFYVESSQGSGGKGGIPRLEYVILAERRGRGLKVVMEPSLSEVLAALVGGPQPPSAAAPPSTPTRPPTPAPTAGPAGSKQLAAEAETAFEAAERALKQGDWAEYGRQIARAREAIRRLRTTLGQ